MASDVAGRDLPLAQIGTNGFLYSPSSTRGPYGLASPRANPGTHGRVRFRRARCVPGEVTSPSTALHNALGEALIVLKDDCWAVVLARCGSRTVGHEFAQPCSPSRANRWPSRRDCRIARCGVQSTPQIQIHIPRHMPVAGFRGCLWVSHGESRHCWGSGAVHLRARPLCRVRLKFV